jgi:polysaccharide export outer membrane protein
MFDPSIMLRTPADYKYAVMNDSASKELYRISPNDVISFSILPNSGERLINIGNPDAGTTQAANSSVSNAVQTYTVDYDGTVKLPVIGRTTISGLSSRQAEDLLEKKYSDYINNPYVNVSVTNKRVFIFRGGNSSSVLSLANQSTTLFEALAQTGGVGDAKAHKIKLIRMVNDKPEVYNIDLSKVSNIKEGNIILHANDIIYVTPRNRVPERILTIITPYMSLIATVLGVIAIFKL